MEAEESPPGAPLWVTVAVTPPSLALNESDRVIPGDPVELVLLAKDRCPNVREILNYNNKNTGSGKFIHPK